MWVSLSVILRIPTTATTAYFCSVWDLPSIHSEHLWGEGVINWINTSPPKENAVNIPTDLAVEQGHARDSGWNFGGVHLPLHATKRRIASNRFISSFHESFLALMAGCWEQ